MNFSARIYRRVQNPEIPNLLKDWIASGPSWKHATDGTEEWRPHISSSKDAIYAIFLGGFLPYWETEWLYKRISTLAYQHRYEGTWTTVQDLLEQNDPAGIHEEIWLELYTPDEFFGNFIPEVGKFLRKNRSSFKKREIYKRPRPKVRRRGYQDKGFQRPPHERGRNLPDPNPGPDFRSKVRHPLLTDSWEGSGGKPHPLRLTKGGTEDGQADTPADSQESS